MKKEAQINKATILLNERMKEITNMLKLFQKKVDLTLEDETTIDMLKKDRSFLELLLKHPEIMIDMLSNDGNRE